MRGALGKKPSACRAGQVRTYTESLATIWLDTQRPGSDDPNDALSTYDFSTPLINRYRGKHYRAVLIMELIENAEKTVLKRFGNQ